MPQRSRSFCCSPMHLKELRAGQDDRGLDGLCLAQSHCWFLAANYRRTRRRCSVGIISFTARRRNNWRTTAYLRFRFLVGNFLRLVLATRRSSFRLIDLYICFDAPRSEDFERWPRLAESAAPAAICCFLDFAGIPIMFRTCAHGRFTLNRSRLAPQKINWHTAKYN